MGTHPIFESDFDCLTEMAFAGSWNKIAVDGVAGFAGVAGIPEDKLAAAGALISTVVTEDGDNYSFERTYPGDVKTMMKFTVGQESEIEGPTGPVNAVVSRDGDALVATITGIAAKIGVEGGKLIENWTAGGQTLTRTSSK